jgi:predicted RNA binding protein YcfA (HicA-like mRNA interferase family)
MTKRDKRLQRLRQNPKNVSFDALKRVLEDYGFEHIRTAGSHHTFVAVIGEHNWRLTIPFNRPIKIPYIRQALSAIDEIIALEKEDEETNDNGEHED